MKLAEPIAAAHGLVEALERVIKASEHHICTVLEIEPKAENRCLADHDGAFAAKPPMRSRLFFVRRH